MSDYDKSKKQLIEELALLHREVAELRTTKTVFDTLHELLLAFVTTEKTATGALTLRAMLQQILQVANRLTEAEEASVFLVNADGVVTESILARGAIIRDLRQKIIGQVLDKGLAGWVIRNRKIGLVTNTINDERWLTLPEQPYTVRSALSLPILRGKELLGILTLMHSQPGHFSAEVAHLMEMIVEQIALILENALLYVERKPLEAESNKILQQLAKDEKNLNKTEEYFNKEERLSSIGIYIIIDGGNFMYTNPGVAAIFGYNFIEFVTIVSIFELVATNNRKLVANCINQCFQSPNKNLSCTFKGQRKDGTLIDIQAYGTKTKLGGKAVIVGLLSLT